MSNTGSLETGRRWVEYILSNSRALSNALLSTGTNVHIIVLHSHLGRKRHYSYGNGADVEPSKIKTEEFEIEIYTRGYEALYGYKINYNKLSNGAFISIDDIKPIEYPFGAFISPRNHSYIKIFREAIYKSVTTMILRSMCTERMKTIKEELIAAVWRPDRLARRLEEGGWEAVDAFV